MNLDRKDFVGFFAALHNGAQPFAWQERLLDELLETGSWPARIVAPTGAGKTAAIDVHVFATALAAGTAESLAPRPPRRLAMVVGRRVLVDDQYAHATALRTALARPERDELRAVAERLRWLRWPTGWPSGSDDDPSPLVVARLRGGVAAEREWRDHPTACAVICGTPDMWGSRLLFGGYGTAPLARPREAGLVALDAAVVMDEAHLARQLLTTARQVARLATAADEPLPVPVLQVVETTATPADPAPTGPVPADPVPAGPALRQVGVAEVDLATEPVLRERMCRPKPVTEVPLPEWPPMTAPLRRRVASRIVDEVVGLLAAPVTDAGDPVHTVGCFVNTVAMAVEVAAALRGRQRPDGAPVRVVAICGQTRPADLERLQDEHPGVLSVTGDPTVDVLVSTQSLEVGVDLDLAAVVTELAPASALAQRAGRVNRRGWRPDGAVHVIVPEGTLSGPARSGPYDPDELEPARTWVSGRAADPAGMAPWAVRRNPPPPAAPRRLLYQRPELADLWHWARTSDQVAAVPELDLWLDDSLEPDRGTAGLVVRDAMPADPSEAVTLVRLLPPRDREVFTVDLATARAIAAEATSGAGAGADAVAPVDVSGDGEPDRPVPLPVVRYRGADDIAVLGDGADPLRPGDILVLDSRIAAFTQSKSALSTGSPTKDGFSPPVPVRPDQESKVDVAPRAPAADVSQTGTPPVGRVALRLEPAGWSEPGVVAELLVEFAAAADGVPGAQQRRLLERLLTAYRNGTAGGPRAGTLAAALALLGTGRVPDSDLMLHRDGTGAPVRLLVLDRRRAWADERVRQSWLPQQRPVPLGTHQDAVAARAEWMATAAGLPPPLVQALRAAGQHHDDGKSDPRFQAALGGTESGEPLAKSGGNSLAESRTLAGQANLPGRWRHEQRSVLACWEPVHTALARPDAQLAARLVGTSHGHGRAGFPHTAAGLLTPGDSAETWSLAEELFDLGAWDNLIETTHQRFGVWGCAYLEALLRAADGQVSAEGR